MKEKIGKLLELLNEYEKRESGISNARTTNFAFLYYLNNPAPISELNLISKKYGFIKWLVENEKIEGEKFQEPKIRGIIGLISNWHNSEGKSYKDYSKELAYESLLMLLSIQDEPIRFLCEILK